MFHETEKPWEYVYRLLQTGGATVALVFAWRLCELVADMAARAESPSLRQSAKLRFWLYAVGVLLPFIGAFLPDVSRALFDEQRAFFDLGVLAAMFVYIAITISLMMGLMAGTARMCARLEREHQEAVEKGEADT